MKNDREVRKRFIQVAIVTSVILVMGAMLLLEYKLGINYGCAIKKYTGLECPGCGATRMVDALLHFKMYQAFRYNPVMFITLPIMCILYIHESIFYIRNNTFSDMAIRVMEVYIAILIVYMICRNMKIFEWLKPTMI